MLRADLAKTLGYDAGGWYAEVYSDTDGGSGYGDCAMVGRWYGSRGECEAVDARTVRLYPMVTSERPDEFDLACERRFD